MTSPTRNDLQMPADAAARDAIRRAVHAHCQGETLVPPLALDEIEALAERILQAGRIAPEFRGFVSVLVGNEVWRDTVAATPFERRILMLPKCVRSSRECPAACDDFGVLCEECGRCAVGGLQREAEDLGYSVLVAEGNTAAAALLGRGEADAVVGVSCLAALEKSFRPLTAHAIPGMAVPLLRDGCADTELDPAWVRDILHLRAPARAVAPRLDMSALRRIVEAWFAADALRPLLQPHGTETEAIAATWLARGGKRWRPLLSACVCQALRTPAVDIPAPLQRIAVAVECFHKASLVHDDIEDDDDARYGVPTLHRQHGVAIAINSGDLLIGEGYRLLAECGATAAQAREMIAVAATGHRTLCLGQGEELRLRDDAARLTSAVVLEIFRRKTAPAFEVALQLGAICADADAATRAVLTAFSEALGVAYQIRDDIEDLATDHAAQPGAPARPSLLVALAREERERRGLPVDAAALSPDAIRGTDAERRAREMFHAYENQALRALRPLRQAPLKSLLFRVVAKILTPPP